MNKKMPGVPESAQNEASARVFVESIIWPDGPVCRHCDSKNVYRMTPKEGSKAPGRKGLLRCRSCKRQFTVTVGTIFEGSHIPLHKWLMAIHLMTASKKGVSAHQLHRMLGITYKAAWFMAHRIRHAMKAGNFNGKMGGKIEVDETYVGGKQKNRSNDMRRRGVEPKKTAVVALVTRSGKARAFPVPAAHQGKMHEVVQNNMKKDAALYTDQSGIYHGASKYFDGGHHVVDVPPENYAVLSWGSWV